MIWRNYIGEISESYRERWEPHTTEPEQKEPDIFDVVHSSYMFSDSLPAFQALSECFSDRIQVDWGGWAYKATVEQIRKYNERGRSSDQIRDEIIDRLDPGKVYAVIIVELD